MANNITEIDLFRNIRPSDNFRVAPVLGSSRTSSTLRSCVPWTPENSSELLGFERGLMKPELEKALWKYNNYRPHANLNGATPMEYIQQNCILEAVSLVID
jgi:transposase InsO family protein